MKQTLGKFEQKESPASQGLDKQVLIEFLFLVLFGTTAMFALLHVVLEENPVIRLIYIVLSAINMYNFTLSENRLYDDLA